MKIGAGCRFCRAHLILSLSLATATALAACEPTKTSRSLSSTQDNTGQSPPERATGSGKQRPAVPGKQRPAVPATMATTAPAPTAGASKPGRTIAFTRQKDGALLVALRNPAGVTMSEITQVRFTPDGKLLAIATKHKELLLWSVTSQKITQLSTRTLPGTVEDMRVSPDGRWLAMTGFRSYLEAAGGGRRRRAARARRLRFEYFLAVVDLTTKRSLADKWETSNRLKAPSFTADSKHLVVLRIPRLDRGTLKGGDTPHPERPTEILAFETQRWERAWHKKLKKGDIRTASVWSTHSQVVYSDYRSLLVINRTSGKARKLRVRHSNGVAYLRVQNRHGLLLSAAQGLNRSPELYLWQMSTGKLKRRFHHGRKDEPALATILKNRYVLGLANKPRPMDSSKPLNDLDRGIFRIWSIANGRLVKKVAKLPVKLITVTSSETGWIAIGGTHLHKPGSSDCRLLLYPPGTLLLF